MQSGSFLPWKLQQGTMKPRNMSARLCREELQLPNRSEGPASEMATCEAKGCPVAVTFNSKAKNNAGDRKCKLHLLRGSWGSLDPAVRPDKSQCSTGSKQGLTPGTLCSLCLEDALVACAAEAACPAGANSNYLQNALLQGTGQARAEYDELATWPDCLHRSC